MHVSAKESFPTMEERMWTVWGFLKKKTEPALVPYPPELNQDREKAYICENILVNINGYCFQFAVEFY